MPGGGRLVPAQTGPAGMGMNGGFGGGSPFAQASHNPFGGVQGGFAGSAQQQQRQTQTQQGGSLIDL